VVFAFSQKVFKEPGVSILAVSAAVSFLCLPLYNIAEKRQAMERDIQKRMKPKIDRIKSVFKGDEQYMILSAYYRQNRYHPVYALRSSASLLIQIPFFIAAYSYLSHHAILRGAHFLFFTDLGKPDALLPLWRNGGGGLAINILPVLMTLINCAAGAIYSRGFLLRDKIQIYGMAAVFLLLLYNSPSGLVIYWTMNNIFSLFKHLYHAAAIKRKKTILAALFSLCCFSIAYYMLRVYHADFSLRAVCAAVFIVSGVVPWLFKPAAKLAAKIPEPAYSGRQIFLSFFLSFIAIWLMAGLFQSSMLIASSAQEFSYIDSYTTPLWFIGNTALQSFGFFVFWPLCLFLLFPGNVKKVFALLGPVLLFCGICNVFFFSGNYGIISIELVYNGEIGHSWLWVFFNFVTLAAITLVVCVLHYARQSRIISLAAAISICSFSVISMYNMAQIQREFRGMENLHTPSRDQITSVEPIHTLSRDGKNTVVIMLDRAQGSFFPFILDESPELRGIYSGFTYYPNTVSFNGYTLIGSPPFFGGYEYTPLEMNKRSTVPLVDKHNEALLLMPRIFLDSGFSVTVVDQPYPNYNRGDASQIYNSLPGINAVKTDSRYTDYWMRDHDFYVPSTSAVLKRNLFWYGIFKISPPAFRRGIYLQGDWCAPGLFNKMKLTLNGYAVLDYMNRLTAVVDGDQNTALIMHNNTTHEPSFLQAPDFRPAQPVTNFGRSPFARETAYHVNAAAIKRLGDWFEYLKAEQVYDNTRIIIAADHGIENTFVIKTNLPFHVDQFNPLLLIKDFNAAGDVQTDTAFMSNADVPFFATLGQIENPRNPFTGKAISIDMKKKPLYIAVSGSIHIHNQSAAKFILNRNQDYLVHDNIFDAGNWIPASAADDEESAD
jgi:YidC/Oxa1 family membrane protein insertase